MLFLSPEPPVLVLPHIFFWFPWVFTWGLPEMGEGRVGSTCYTSTGMFWKRNCEELFLSFLSAIYECLDFFFFNHIYFLGGRVIIINMVIMSYNNPGATVSEPPWLSFVTLHFFHRQLSMICSDGIFFCLKTAYTCLYSYIFITNKL